MTKCWVCRERKEKGKKDNMVLYGKGHVREGEYDPKNSMKFSNKNWPKINLAIENSSVYIFLYIF